MVSRQHHHHHPSSSRWGALRQGVRSINWHPSRLLPGLGPSSTQRWTETARWLEPNLVLGSLGWYREERQTSRPPGTSYKPWNGHVPPCLTPLSGLVGQSHPFFLRTKCHIPTKAAPPLIPLTSAPYISSSARSRDQAVVWVPPHRLAIWALPCFLGCMRLGLDPGQKK